MAGSLDVCLFAAIAALIRCKSGGFSPQAKHGGNGVFALAMAGSKFDGTGLEKEHMGQTHVAEALGGGAGAGGRGRNGLPLRGGVEVGLYPVLLPLTGTGLRVAERFGRLEGLG